MPKINIEEVQAAMQSSGIDYEKQKEVLNHLQEVIKELEEAKEAPAPKVKNEFGVILIDENGEIKGENIAALIYQIKVDEPHEQVFGQLKKVVTEFNLTKKGQKNPIYSVTEAFEHIKPKLFKNNGLIKKTKTLVKTIKSNNKI